MQITTQTASQNKEGGKGKKHIQLLHYFNEGTNIHSALIGLSISRCLKTINVKSTGHFKSSIKSIITSNLKLKKPNLKECK